MRINQTSQIHKVDVGTPLVASLSNDNDGELIEVRFHGFQDLTVARGEGVISPEFTCFGHRGIYLSILVEVQLQTMVW